MNLLSEIIRRLNQRIGVANIFDKQFGLCELNANGNDKAWIHYIGDGQGEVVTNFDAKQGTIFWAKRGKVNISIIDSLKVSGCKKMYQTTFPLTAYAVVRKSHIPCDSEDAQDWIASRVFKLTSGMDFGFKQSIGVMSYEVIPNGYVNEIKSLTQNYEWACVSIDIDVQIVSSADDGCYDTCQTGEIPLPPNYEPCTPCLTEVAVDGVTITGNGTVADPLVAIGGGGGTPLITKEEGTTVSANTTTLNFTGAGATATLTSPGVVEVNIPGGGSGGVGTLQEVTDLGNTTTNDIDFGTGVGILLDNGARLREGTTDGGLGGNKGIAQRCSIDYELKWEAGRLYVMQQDGFIIREVRNTFTATPTVNDDVTDGYVVGSRWVTDAGDVYVCTDPTATAAVWEIIPNADWNATGGSQEIANKPTIPAAQVNSDWSAVSGVEEILNKPTITTPVNADWNSVAGLSEILNKPSIPAAQIQSDWTQANNAALDFIKNKPAIPSGTVTSVSASVPVALSVTVTNPTTTPAIAITAAGVASQYIRGDGQLATLPSNASGGSAVSYYLNGGTAASVATYFQMSQTAVIGTGVDFNKAGNGLISQWLTDVGDPNRLEIPAGNWNFEIFMSASSNGGTPAFYVELLKYNGSTFTTIANSSAAPENITGGTSIDLYLTSLAIPQTTLLVTDRLAIRVYIVNSVGGRTITMHTQDSHLCQVVTNFAGGIAALNGLIANTQYLAVGTTGTNFAISSVSDTHTFNLPTASATNRGALSTTDWIAFNAKQAALGFTPVTNARTLTINGTAQDLSADRSWTIPALTVFKDTTTGTASSGISNTASKTQLIAANTFAVGDIIQVDFGSINKTGSAGAQTLRMYVNATADIAGSPILLGTYTTGTPGAGARVDRRLVIKSATVTETAFGLTTLITDLGFNLMGSSNIDWTSARYFVFTIQNTNAADSSAISYFRIMKT